MSFEIKSHKKGNLQPFFMTVLLIESVLAIQKTTAKMWPKAIHVLVNLVIFFSHTSIYQIGGCC